MWKPIQPPGEWLVFLQRKDIKGLPIMEARKRYMQEQLLFENYYSNLQTLNTVNTVSPSVASSAAAGGGGGPRKRRDLSGARGGGPLSLFLDMEVYIPGLRYSIDWDRSRFLSNYTPGLENELPQPFTIYDWTFSDDPAWATNSWTSTYYQNYYDTTYFSPPNTWVNGMPFGNNPSELLTNLRSWVDNTDDNYLSVVSGSIRSGFDDYATEARSATHRELQLPISWDLEEPIRVDWGDGNINNYSGPQDYPDGGSSYATTRYTIPYSSTDSSLRWSVESSSAYVNDKVWVHAYDIEHLVPESWVPFIPEPDTYYPRPIGTRNTYYRYAQETPITSSNGLFPWGTRFNDWYNWTPVTHSIKIYGNPLAGNHSYGFRGTKVLRINYLDPSKYTTFNRLFYYAQYIDITPLNIGAWDVSHITDMSEMFRASQILGRGIKQNDLGNWDVSNVTNMSFMFGSSNEPINLSDPGDIGKWDVSNVTDMSYMFNGGIGGYRISGQYLSSDLSNWDVSNVTNFKWMFWHNNAFQHNTNFNNWDISSGEDFEFMFYQSSFKERLTNWNIKDGASLRNIFSYVAMSHTDFFETLKAWASGSASNVNMSDFNTSYPTVLGSTPSISLDKRNNGTGGNVAPWDTSLFWNNTDFINLADFRKWFCNYNNNTGVTLISGSSNHQAYETLLSRGWSMPGNIDILETGSIAASRITQVPIQVTVSGSQFVMSSSVFLPISEIQPYDNYDPLYTPTLTYRFDQSDVSNTGHPLKFSETLDGTHGGGTEYRTDVTTVGTPGTSGSYTDIIVSNLNGFEVEYKPKLYTYCENHSGMSEFYLEAYV